MKTTMRRKAFLLSSMALALAACTADEVQHRYSTDYPCSFGFYTSLHPTSLIKVALDNPSTYVFVDVKTEKQQSNAYNLNKLTVSLYGGSTETITLTTDKENARIGQVGANQSLIIGTSAFDGWRAYDRMCPYCLDHNTGTNFPLTWGSNGASVACNRCQRTYELNYGNSTDGIRLKEYHIRYDGTPQSEGLLRVTNR